MECSFQRRKESVQRPCVYGGEGCEKEKETGNVGVEIRQKRTILELPRMIDHLGKEEILE